MSRTFPSVPAAIEDGPGPNAFPSAVRSSPDVAAGGWGRGGQRQPGEKKGTAKQRGYYLPLKRGTI